MGLGDGPKVKKRRPVKARGKQPDNETAPRGEGIGVVETRIATLDETGVDRHERAAWRRALGNEYVFHPKGISLAQLANHPDLGNIPLATVTEWSRKDNWVARRKRFGELIQKQVEKNIAGKIVKEQLDELRKLIELRGKLEKKVDQSVAETELKSLEQGISVLLKLDARIDARREQIQSTFVERALAGDQTEDESEQQQQQPLDVGPLKPKFSDVETVVAAKAVLNERREVCPGETNQQAVPAAPPVAPRKKRPPPRRAIADGPDPKS